MPLFQAKNKKTGVWVKYELYGGKSTFVDAKQRETGKPFKGVPIRQKRR